MSRRKQARPRLCKRDEDEALEDNDSITATACKKAKLSNTEELDVGIGNGCVQETSPEVRETVEVFRCETCAASFDNILAFMDHRNSECETGTLPYKADNGDSRSGTPSSLDSKCSMDSPTGGVHPDQVPFHDGVDADHRIPCLMCNKAFSQLRLLKIHEQVHTDLMPYDCPHCPRVFQHKRSRDRHVILHTDDRKFNSTQCDAAFSRPDHLKGHIKSYINDEKYPCQLCSLEYPTMAALMSHQNAHKQKHSHAGADISDKYACHVCYKTCTSLDVLLTHMKSHDGSDDVELTSEILINPSDIPTIDFSANLMPNQENSSLCPTDVLVCPYCLRDNFDTLEGLEIHMQGVHSVKPTEVYTCNYCNAPYKNLYSLHEHMRAIHQNQPSMGIKYPCSRCGKEYPSIEALQEHKKRMHHHKKHTENVHSCSQCSVNFLSSTSLREHVQIAHRDKNKHESSNNQKNRTGSLQKPAKINSSKLKETLSHMNDSPTIINVPEPSHLLRHLRSPLISGTVHHGSESPGDGSQTTSSTPSYGRNNHKQEKFICDQCSGSFSDLSSYQTHMKLHIDSVLGQFACRQCNKLFVSEEKLESHISTHYLCSTSEYCCTSCNKTFHKPDELQKHLMDIHAHHLFKCSLCKDVFDSKVNIQVHFAIKHSNESKLYKCITCDTVYRSESEWHLHLRVTHLQVAKPYRCLFCKESLSSEMDLQCHLATHNKPFKCSMCDESFLVEFLLDKHLQNVHSSGASNSSGTSPRSGRESIDSRITTVKTEKDSDTCSSDLSASGVASLYSSLLSSAASQCSMLLGNGSPLLGDAGSLYGSTAAGAGSLVWRSPDDLYRCNICDMKFSEVTVMQNHKLQDHGVKYSPSKSPYSPSSSPQQTLSSSNETLAAMYNSLLAQQTPDIVSRPSDRSSARTQDQPSSSLLHDALKPTMSLPLNPPHSPNMAFSEKLASAFGEKLCLACTFCSQTFKNKADLEKHSKIHLNTGSQKCNICDEVFASTGILAEHKLTHCKIQQGNVCVACKIPIRNEDQFYVHSQEHGFQGAVMQCIVCRQTLASMLELQMHGRHHFQNKASFHTCCVCLKAFESSDSLVSKLNSSGRTYYVCKPCYHGDSNDFSCNQCRLTLDSKVALDAHLLTHKKSYQCIKCQESFNSEHDIQMHVASHMMQEGNMHECKLCFLILDSPAKLQCHLIEHTYRNSEYNCSICGRIFRNAIDIQAHALEHGIAARKYGCSHCSQKFFFSAELENHLFVHNKGIDQDLSSSNRTSNIQQSLTIHPLKNQFSDELSKVSFLQSDSTTCYNVQSQQVASSSENDVSGDDTIMSKFEFGNENSTKNHSTKRKSIQCSDCSKIFTNVTLLQSHYFSAHTLDKADVRAAKCQCPECGKQCSTQSNLLSHMNTHIKGSMFSCTSCSPHASLHSHLTGSSKTSTECQNCHKRSKKGGKPDPMKVQSEDKIYPCVYCCKVFSCKTSVQDHIKLCQLERQSGILEDHVQNETGSVTSEDTVASLDHVTDDDLSCDKDGMKPEVTSTSNISEESNSQ